MTEAAANAAKKGEESVETIIELVDHLPISYLILALVTGAVVTAAIMLAVSKPPTPPQG